MIVALCVLVGFALDLGFAVVIGRAISRRPATRRPSVLLRMPENRHLDKFAVSVRS